MVGTRKTQNPLVYLIAWILTGICSFLGFKGPAWARAAVGGKHSPAPATLESDMEISPSVARAVAAAGPKRSAKPRRSGTKKATPRKRISKKSARERTSQMSSL